MYYCLQFSQWGNPEKLGEKAGIDKRVQGK